MTDSLVPRLLRTADPAARRTTATGTDPTWSCSEQRGATPTVARARSSRGMARSTAEGHALLTDITSLIG